MRSLDRLVRVVPPNGKETTARKQGKILAPGRCTSGHLSVSLGRANSVRVHQLVMLAFKGPCPRGHEVLHLDHAPANNALTNLRYGTRGENLKMDYEAGSRRTHPNFIGARWRA